MNQDIRRDLISRNLGINPISHGQIHTFQIALPEAKKQPISLKRRQAIEQSFVTHQSNLTSLIVRRTNAYADEDVEYELVYGADWLQVAQELGIEKVWAWVFDLTDEEAIATVAIMETLAAIPTSAEDSPTTGTYETPHSSPDQLVAQIDKILDQKLQLATDSIKHSVTAILSGIRADLDEKLKVLNYRMDSLSIPSSPISSLESVLEKLDSLQQQIIFNKKPLNAEFTGDPINLLQASDQEIAVVLQQVKAQPADVQGAIAAIRHWQNAEQGLTWDNLARSARAKPGSKYKFKGFAQGTYDRLRRVAEIPE